MLIFQRLEGKKKGLSQERAGDGIRTHDNNVGNVVLYQLSYTRKIQNLADALIR
jgi:hypothetical protein